MATATEASSDRTEVGVTITARPDQLGIEHDAPRAQPLAELAELGELARCVAAGTSPEGESAAVDAHLGADPI